AGTGRTASSDSFERYTVRSPTGACRATFGAFTVAYAPARGPARVRRGARTTGAVRARTGLVTRGTGRTLLSVGRTDSSASQCRRSRPDLTDRQAHPSSPRNGRTRPDANAWGCRWWRWVSSGRP